jgi:lysophospholipase L1-like esterase
MTRKKPNPLFPRFARRRTLLILLGVACVLIAGVAFYLHLYFDRSIGSGAAGPTFAREPFAHSWTTRRVMLVGMGDSITAGFGARRGYGYFDLLVSNPTDESPEMKGISLSAVLTNLIVTNLSVSGSISHELAESQLRQLPRAGMDTVGWVVITTGGNDLIHNYGRTPPREQAMYGATWEQAEPWLEKFTTRLETIVTGLTERFPGGCQVFLANIYDPTDGVGDMGPAGLPGWPDGLKIIESYNEALRLCADRHPGVHLVKLHDEFLGHGIHCAQFWSKHYNSRDPHYWYYANLEDPNERGYDPIRRLFLIEMAKAAKQFN